MIGFEEIARGVWLDWAVPPEEMEIWKPHAHDSFSVGRAPRSC